jgi:predicted metal-dependent phosphoesterase TrpH
MYGGKMFIDTHVHTKYSDGTGSIQNILKNAKKRGIGLAITDHNVIKGAVKAVQHNGNTIIPGIEVGTVENRHVSLLFYNAKELQEFYNKEIENKRIKDKWFNWWRTTIPTVELIDTATQYNCLIIAPHPYNRLFTEKNWSPKKIPNIKKIHAIETINSAVTPQSNSIAKRFAEKLNKPQTAGSDAHNIQNIGKAGILTEGSTINEILENIKKGKITPKGLSFNPFEYYLQCQTVVVKNILPK